LWLPFQAGGAESGKAQGYRVHPCPGSDQHGGGSSAVPPGSSNTGHWSNKVHCMLKRWTECDCLIGSLLSVLCLPFILTYLAHTPDRCSEMCCFTGSAIVVQHTRSKLGLSALLKGTVRFSPCRLRYLNQQPFSSWTNALIARLPAIMGRPNTL
jgi:hypothetical protein